MIRYQKGIIRQLKTRPDDVVWRKDILYNDNIFCFDIEVSSGYVSKGLNVTQDLVKVSLCYLWALSINYNVIYGRDICEVEEVLAELLQLYDGELIIWVHNFGYEFQFLLNCIDWDKIFARAPHKVIYAKTSTITFRCTYFLTRYSLANWAYNKKLPVKKLVGNVDYRVTRTPKTILPQSLYDYQENDVLVMYYGLLEYKKRYKHLYAIPLTQTGEVRVIVKKLLNDYKHHRKMCELVPKSASEYALLKACFWGGWTGSNYNNTDIVIYNAHSKDISSSYPASMVSNKFPMTPFEIVKPKQYNNYLNNDKYSLILDVTFIDITSKISMDYIPSSKCYYYDDNTVLNNGKILASPRIDLFLTNVDYDIIVKCYRIKTIRIKSMWQSINEYLPKKFIEYILDLYHNKTTLKGIEELYSEYMFDKEQFNALYGMSVTSIIQENILFDGHEWKPEKLTDSQLTEKLIELSNKPYKNFLAYQWGVWVTAYSRKNLFEPIATINHDMIYSDTDSLKYTGNYEYVFEQYNNKLYAKLKSMCDYYNIDISRCSAKDNKGNVHTIGFYESEKDMQEIKTLGAKRYAYRDSDGLHLTVSGVSKEWGVLALNDDINNLTDELEIEPQYSRKLVLTYLDDMPNVIWNKGHYDEYLSKYRYGIHAEETSYNLSLLPSYVDLISIDTPLENLDVSAQELYKIIKKGCTYE